MEIKWKQIFSFIFLLISIIKLSGSPRVYLGFLASSVFIIFYFLEFFKLFFFSRYNLYYFQFSVQQYLQFSIDVYRLIKLFFLLEFYSVIWRNSTYLELFIPIIVFICRNAAILQVFWRWPFRFWPFLLFLTLHNLVVSSKFYSYLTF